MNQNDYDDTDNGIDPVITEAKERYEIAQEAWNTYKTDANSTLKFYSGEQWDNQLKMNRSNAGLPSLQVNKLKNYIRNITSEIRQNTPQIQIDPKDEIATQDTADVLDGLIRSIQVESNASTAYDISAQYAAGVGLGYFRIISEYETDDSEYQRLCIKAIDNPNTVLIDPTHRDAAGSDMDYAFVITTMSKDAYLREYPESKMSEQVSLNGWSSIDTTWVSEHEVLIAEYYYKVWKDSILFKVFNNQNGMVLNMRNTEKGFKDLVKAGVIKVMKEIRRDKIATVKWCKLNDVEVLEETDWPGPYIPIIPVKGDEIWVDNKRLISGLLQDAIDSQRAFNYFFSLEAELVQLAPKTPFIGEIRQFANFEKLWRDANVAPNAYLPYNAVSLEGQPLPPPARQSVEVPIQAAASLCAQANDNLKSIFGVFDASLGATSNEVSAKAILARQQQSHASNYQWYDNLIRSITHAGRILLAAIPTFYDAERIIRITKADGEKKSVIINAYDPQTGMMHDFSKGKFDVAIETGPSYSTRRQEAVESMLTLMGGMPPQMQANYMDIVTRNMDWPGAKEFAKRAAAQVPPDLLEASGDMNDQTAKALSIQLRSQVKQQGQMLQQLNAHAHQVEQELKLAKDQLQLVKQDKSIDIEKAKMDFVKDNRQMDINEKEIKIQAILNTRKLELQEKQLELNSAEVASEMASDMMDHVNKKHKTHKELNSKDVMSITEIENPSMGGDLTGKLNPV